MNFLYCSLVVLIFSGSGSGLRLLSYQIPSVVDIHDEAVLSCNFDPEHEQIDTYSWSVNGTVFYTHSPTGKFVHHVNGVNVKADESHRERVVLYPLELATSGVYRCEASTHSSTPNSLAIQKTINVVALPRAGPSIEGIHSNHTWGELVHLNCTSAPSYPPADIIWLLGNTPVQENQLTLYPELAEDASSPTRRTKVGVRLQTDELPFDGAGEASVTCVALVPGLFRSMATLRLHKAHVVKYV